MAYKIAVVGIGKIARDQHLPCIAKNKNFQLVAAVSRHGKVEGVANFTSLAELKASKLKVDCVALCTPPSVRLAMANIRQKSPILRDMERKGEIAIVGGMYDLETGKVSWLD